MAPSTSPGRRIATPGVHGWILGYEAKTLAQVVAKSVTPDGRAGGIWQSNSGPSADDLRNLYVSVGSGSVSAPNGGQDYGNAFLRLDRSGAVLDWFIPFDTEALSKADHDVGSTGVLIVPESRLIVGGSKKGKAYVLGRNKLGHFQPACTARRPIGTALEGPYVYMWGSLDRGKAFLLRGGRLIETPHSQTADLSKGRPGGILSISANGRKAGTGIVWATLGFSDANQAKVPGALHAFDAMDLSRELWNSAQNAARNRLGDLAKFNTPIVARGKVYMATFSREVVVHGLLPEAEK